MRAVAHRSGEHGLDQPFELLARVVPAGLSPRPEEARDEILHTVACKAAIKAGWDNSSEELEKLVEAVLSGAVRYCPHGRPVSAVLTKKELDKLFRRIV